MPCLLGSVSILCFHSPSPALVRRDCSLCLTSHMFQWRQAWCTVLQSPPGCHQCKSGNPGMVILQPVLQLGVHIWMQIHIFQQSLLIC